MNPRHFGIASAVVCIGVVVIVAAIDLRHFNYPESSPEQLTPGAEPLVSIGSPDDVFHTVLDGPLADHALHLEPAGANDAASPVNPSPPLELPQVEPLHVPQLSNSHRATTEAVIRRYLPRASDHERRCWLDETCGLSAAQVAELLQLRTQIGSLVSPLDGRLSLPVEKRLPHSGARSVLSEARRIVLGNLLNGDSIGYRAIEVTFAGNAAANGESLPALASLTISTAQGELVTTERSLDVAVEGEGFLQVTFDGQTRLTRFGRLTIGADRKLALDVTGPSVRPSPEIEIPLDVQGVRILDNGQIEVKQTSSTEWAGTGALTLVAVPFPEHLRSAESGTYAPTHESGKPLKIVPGMESGSIIHSGMLEKSNVDRKAESQRLKRIDWLRKQLNRAEDVDTD